MSVEFRPVTTEDEPFLFELYSATRIEELAAWGWDQSQWEPFLRMQFAAQQQHYRTQFPEADHLILVLDQQPIGRTVVSRRIQEVRLVDIALLPEHRNAGIGTRFLEDLQAEAKNAGTPVCLQVLKSSPAVRLYERLGFSTTGDSGLHYQMEWISSGICVERKR